MLTVQHRKSAIHGLPITLRMLRVSSDKSDWFWSQAIVFTKPFKTGMSLDLARGRDSWCWPKGARPLGTRMFCSHLRTKEMLDGVEDDVWWKSNFVQHHPTSCNIVQHGGYTSATCWIQQCWMMLHQHVGSVWIRLHVHVWKFGQTRSCVFDILHQIGIPMFITFSNTEKRFLMSSEQWN